MSYKKSSPERTQRIFAPSDVTVPSAKGVLVIIKFGGCIKCIEYEKNGFFDKISRELKVGDVKETTILNVEDNDLHDIYNFDKFVPSFIYMSNETFEHTMDKKYSKESWKAIYNKVRFLNRELDSSNNLMPKNQYPFTLEGIQQFCDDSEVSLSALLDTQPNNRARLVMAYPKK